MKRMRPPGCRVIVRLVSDPRCRLARFRRPSGLSVGHAQVLRGRGVPGLVRPFGQPPAAAIGRFLLEVEPRRTGDVDFVARGSGRLEPRVDHVEYPASMPDSRVRTRVGRGENEGNAGCRRSRRSSIEEMLREGQLLTVGEGVRIGAIVSLLESEYVVVR